MLSGQVISTCYLLILGVGAAPADGAEADRWSLEEEEQEYGDPNMEHEFDMELKEARFPFQKFPASYLKKALAEGVDWTLDKRGVVTSPKNQGHHGYCGTFSRVAQQRASMSCIRDNRLVTLASSSRSSATDHTTMERMVGS